MRDICLGLQALHSKKIIHLDIKPENVLISNSKKFKLADLGLARLVTKLDGNVPEGDSRYLAPELLNEDPAALVPDLTKADIFSLGIMIYELMRNKPLPLNGEEWQDIRNGKADFTGLKLYSYELQELISRTLLKDPIERPSATEILTKYLPSPEELEIRNLKAENRRLKLELADLQSKIILPKIILRKQSI